MMDWGNGAWSTGDWATMIAMMFLFWGAVIAAAVWIIRLTRSNRVSTKSDRADTLLAERFARGEIDGDEFSRSRELLHNTSRGEEA